MTIQIGDPTGISQNISATATASVAVLSLGPPSNLQGKQKKNDFGLQYELYNQLTWTPSPTPYIIGYFIYRDGEKIARVDASTHTYKDHNRKKGVSYIYAVTAFDSLGSESSPVTIVIKP